MGAREFANLQNKEAFLFIESYGIQNVKLSIDAKGATVDEIIKFLLKFYIIPKLKEIRTLDMSLLDV